MITIIMSSGAIPIVLSAKSEGRLTKRNSAVAGISTSELDSCSYFVSAAKFGNRACVARGPGFRFALPGYDPSQIVIREWLEHGEEQSWKENNG
jgi:hypothetical protein